MTPRLAASPFALRRPSSQKPARSRSWVGLLCVAASLTAHGALLALVLPSPTAKNLPADSPGEPPVVLEDIAVTVLPKPVVVDALPTEEIAQPTAPVPVLQAAPPAVSAAPVPPVSPPVPSPVVPEPVPPAPPAPPEEVSGPYVNFPHLGGQTACQGLSDCWRSPVSSSWRSVASDLEERLEAQGYTLSNVTGEVLAIDSGVRVYVVSKPGEPDYFLNLVSVADGVLYTMTAEPMTSAQVLVLQRS